MVTRRPTKSMTSASKKRYCAASRMPSRNHSHTDASSSQSSSLAETPRCFSLLQAATHSSAASTGTAARFPIRATAATVPCGDDSSYTELNTTFSCEQSNSRQVLEANHFDVIFHQRTNPKLLVILNCVLFEMLFESNSLRPKNIFAEQQNTSEISDFLSKTLICSTLTVSSISCELEAIDSFDQRAGTGARRRPGPAPEVGRLAGP
jgi:hypothetical protein